MPPVNKIPVTSVQVDKSILTSSKNILRLFYPVEIKVLIVLDGSIGIAGGSNLDLSKMIESVQSNEFYPAARVKIDCAQRDGPYAFNESVNSHQFRFQGFRFTSPDLNINAYDQVWFFGLWPGNNRFKKVVVNGVETDQDELDANGKKITVWPDHTEARFNPLSVEELSILTIWMDTKQGGVFATGDHEQLGASMCYQIPRVRNMRRWTKDQQVPGRADETRHDTNQRENPVGIIEFNAQGDNTPQRIEVKMRRYRQSAFEIVSYPHPVLCGVDGVIDMFPDHAHEGETLGRHYGGLGGLSVDTSFNLGDYIPGYVKAEYPEALSGLPKPEPEIIGVAHVFNDPDLAKNHDLYSNPTSQNESTAFGVTSTYDGSLAGVGRVVVDSTWHHWMDVNLNGFALDLPAYKHIRNYFHNIAIWLCRDQLRNQIMHQSVWYYTNLIYDPMLFVSGDSLWKIGKAAKDALGRIAGKCNLREWTIEIAVPRLERPRFEFEVPFDPFKPPKPNPCLSCPPGDALEIAVLGGLVKSLMPLAEKYRIADSITRIRLDQKEFSSLSANGIKLGQATYLEAMSQSKENLEVFERGLKKAFRVPKVDEFQLEIERRNLTIEVDSILFKDGKLPFLLQDPNFVLEFTVSINGVVISQDARVSVDRNLKFERLEVFNGLSVATLELPLVREEFEQGEQLLIELHLVAQDKGSALKSKLWERTFDGTPSEWIGLKLLDLEDSTDTINKVDVVINILEAKTRTK
jgi:hypothetical protein